MTDNFINFEKLEGDDFYIWYDYAQKQALNQIVADICNNANAGFVLACEAWQCLCNYNEFVKLYNVNTDKEYLLTVDDCDDLMQGKKLHLLSFNVTDETREFLEGLQ